MSFGRNPHVPKAEAAEQKANDATDERTRERALREAAHQWDRAAEREKPGKRRDEYAGHAARLRADADALAEAPEAAPADASASPSSRLRLVR
jgi:hypothetical protein